MINAVRRFYADGKPHSNSELYKALGGSKERNHCLRGYQQALKNSGELSRVGRGVWCGNPNAVKRKIIDAVRRFYSDGKLHRNTELYNALGGSKERNHCLRGFQQFLKRSGELRRVARGVWCHS